jgi:hypothetical protein
MHYHGKLLCAVLGLCVFVVLLWVELFVDTPTKRWRRWLGGAVYVVGISLCVWTVYQMQGQCQSTELPPAQ